MTHRNTWKQKERDVGALFGCRRRRGSGCDPETGGDDIVHPRLFVEVRLRKNMTVLKWWEKDVVEPAQREGKFPVLVIFQKGKGQPFIVAPLDAEYLKTILKELEAAGGDQSKMSKVSTT